MLIEIVMIRYTEREYTFPVIPKYVVCAPLISGREEVKTLGACLRKLVFLTFLNFFGTMQSELALFILKLHSRINLHYYFINSFHKITRHHFYYYFNSKFKYLFT